MLSLHKYVFYKKFHLIFQSKKTVKVSVIEPCKDHPKDAIMHINNVQLTDTISGTRMYFEANVTEDWPKGMVVRI